MVIEGGLSLVAVGVGHMSVLVIAVRLLLSSARIHGTRIAFPEGHDFNAWFGKFVFRGWVSWRVDIYLHNRGLSVPLKSGLNRCNMIQSRIESIQIRVAQGRCPLIMRIVARRRQKQPLIMQIGAR